MQNNFYHHSESHHREFQFQFVFSFIIQACNKNRFLATFFCLLLVCLPPLPFSDDSIICCVVTGLILPYLYENQRYLQFYNSILPKEISLHSLDSICLLLYISCCRSCFCSVFLLEYFGILANDNKQITTFLQFP